MVRVRCPRTRRRVLERKGGIIKGELNWQLSSLAPVEDEYARMRCDGGHPVDFRSGRVGPELILLFVRLGRLAAMVRSDSVHTIARSGFADGTNELYDRLFVSVSHYEITHSLSRARPSYPSDALEYIRQEVPVSGSLDIVEYNSYTPMMLPR